MVDTLFWEGRSYELPKKTLATQKKIDEVSTLAVNNKGYDSYQKQWDFCVERLGKDNATEVLDANNINGVDLQTLTICYNSIIDTYTKRVREYNTQKELEQVDTPSIRAMADLANNVDKIAKI